MLKFLILASIILWVDGFFGRSEFPGTSLKNTSITVLSVIIVTLIIIGFLS